MDHAMTQPRRIAGALVATAIASTAAAAARQEVFRGGTDRVVLNITVVDGKGRLLAGLGQDDFVVFEDGRPQSVTYFSNEALPVALSLLLDSSVSMEGKMRVAQDAAIGFVKRLRPHDIAQVIDFDSRVSVRQPFTNDHRALEQAIRATQPDGSTSLYQSLYIAQSELSRDRARVGDQIRREAIVVLSDGEDTTSLIDYDQVLDSSRRTGVIVYAIGLRAKDQLPSQEYRSAEYVLRTLSNETGGRVFFVSDTAELPAVYGQIAGELAGQYTLGYRSTNPKRDGTWRRLAIRVTRGEAAARTRTGYFAPKGGS
jgi:Ca-activated chloride channel family protein